MVAQVGRQDLRIPAAARRQFHHRHRRLDAEERQRFIRVAGAVAQRIGRRARTAGDGRLQGRVARIGGQRRAAAATGQHDHQGRGQGYSLHHHMLHA
ncbi:hypothetical protein D3C72_2243110 [compost metagenome]